MEPFALGLSQLPFAEINICLCSPAGFKVGIDFTAATMFLYMFFQRPKKQMEANLLLSRERLWSYQEFWLGTCHRKLLFSALTKASIWLRICCLFYTYITTIARQVGYVVCNKREQQSKYTSKCPRNLQIPACCLFW